jgi:hypothetical protein
MQNVRLSKDGQHAASTGLSNSDLGCTPRRRDKGGCDQANHGVGPSQPFVQTLLPVLTNGNAFQITVEKHLVAIRDQPATHHGSQP